VESAPACLHAPENTLAPFRCISSGGCNGMTVPLNMSAGPGFADVRVDCLRLVVCRKRRRRMMTWASRCSTDQVACCGCGSVSALPAVGVRACMPRPWVSPGKGYFNIKSQAALSAELLAHSSRSTAHISLRSALEIYRPTEYFQHHAPPRDRCGWGTAVQNT
jgi:hypothetical protein